LEDNWRSKTLENLVKREFGDPMEAPTNMVKRCLELCRTPLSEFTVEDIRLMIAQGFSLEYLVPLASEHLIENIFAEGDYYPGDLLANVLKIDQEFWRNNRPAWKEIADSYSICYNAFTGASPKWSPSDTCYNFITFVRPPGRCLFHIFPYI